MYLFLYYIYLVFLNRVIYFIEISVEIIQMYLFSIKCKFYCIYTLNAYFIHVFSQIIFTHELL